MVVRSRQAFAVVPAAVLGVFLAAAGGGDPALGQTFREAATARGTTVNTRPRPEYDPLGVRLGAFRLDASAELGLGYDDNVFGTDRNRQGDGFFDDQFNAALASDWTTHAVGISGSLSERRYFSQSDLDWHDWTINAFGRLDIDRDSSVEASYSHQRLHLDVSSVDLQQAGVSRPAPYDLDLFQVTGNTRFNRLALVGLFNYGFYRFENIDVGGQPQPLSLNDYQTWIAAAGAAYAFAPGRSGTLVARFQDIRYDNAASRGRDSFTWEVLVGFQYDFDGVWQARGGIGYRQRNYSSPAIKNLEGVALEGQLTWAASQITTVTLGIRRTIEESISPGQVGYTRTLFQANLDHEIRRNVILGAELGADRREYDNSSLRATDGYTILSARWLLNRTMTLSASYQFVTRLEASGGADEYYRNLVQLRLRFAL